MALMSATAFSQSLPFFDNFNDGNDDGWIKPEGNRDWAVARRVYTRGYEPMSTDGHYISYVGDTSLKDYSVAVDARTMTDATGWAALLFRISGDGDYYAFQIEPATNYAKLERRTDHAYTILRETNTLSLSSKKWYRLRVNVLRDSVRCFVNGSLIFACKGIRIGAGGAGLAGWHQRCEFDDFCITELTPTPVLHDAPAIAPNTSCFTHRDGRLVISLGDGMPATVALHDAHGRLVHRQSPAAGAREVRIDTGRYSPGAYACTIETGGRRVVFAFVVRR